MTRQEFIILLEEEGKSIYSFCHMLTGDKEEADELYQETMLSATEHCSNIDNSGNPKSYLISLCLGIYKNQRRKQIRRQRIAPVSELTEELSAVLKDENAVVEKEVLRMEICNKVRQEIKALPENLRVSVYLFYSAQLSVEEIAKMLHIPKGTVKSRLHKARIIIKEKMEDYGYEGREKN